MVYKDRMIGLSEKGVGAIAIPVNSAGPNPVIFMAVIDLLSTMFGDRNWRRTHDRLLWAASQARQDCSQRV